MPDTRPHKHSAQFFVVSITFWAFVVLLTVIWPAVYRFMEQFIRMRSEYSLPEQGTNFILLLVLACCLLTYRSEENAARIKLSISFILLTIVMYLSESNLIYDPWRSIFTAASLLMVLWQLVKISLPATALMVVGIGALAIGLFGDVWHDYPSTLPAWASSFGRIAYSVEEPADLWATAFFAYSFLTVFRNTLINLFLHNLWSLSILVISVGLIASGNSFAHWQYQPGHKMQMLATGMALVGFSGVALVREKLWRGRLPFGLNDASVFYTNFALLFLVLPVAYGGMSALLNAVMWLCYFALAGAYLYRSNPRMLHSRLQPISP